MSNKDEFNTKKSNIVITEIKYRFFFKKYTILLYITSNFNVDTKLH